MMVGVASRDGVGSLMPELTDKLLELGVESQHHRRTEAETGPRSNLYQEARNMSMLNLRQRYHCRSVEIPHLAQWLRPMNRKFGLV
jgi:hypothetical protein